tara:strand:+ start:7775 stop:10204 length:2430 start_codon:yes stop_codon:yes gene_type:complete
MNRFENMSITAKVMLPVALLGGMAVLITIYSLVSLYAIDRDYRTLLNRDTVAMIALSDAQRVVSESGQLLYEVLADTARAPEIDSAKDKMKEYQILFGKKINEARLFLSRSDDHFSRVISLQQHWFSLGLQWLDVEAGSAEDGVPGRQVLMLLKKELDLELAALKANAMKRYQAVSGQLENKARSTLIVTVVAAIGALLTFLALALYLSFSYVSRPVKTLTRTMKRINNRQFSDSIDYIGQQDEIGQMAKVLKRISEELQQIDQLRQEALEHAQARHLAERTVETKSMVLTAISHEIRTPLNAIITLLGLLLKNELTDQQYGRVESAQAAGRHLLEVVNDVLDFSKIDSGHMKIECVPFSLQQVLADVEGMLIESATAKGLRLDFDDAAHIPALKGDPLRISQILINYISNAIKFSDEGTISVGMNLRYEGNKLYLRGWVQDEGVGLSASEIELLFQPFWQGRGSVMSRFGGSGLGLAICRRLAHLMGGCVWVESEPGQGSCFWFEVHVEISDDFNESFMLSTSQHRPRSREMLHGLRVLIVDDSELNRLVAQELLVASGVQVDLAVDGFDALQRLERMPDDYYSAVLMDVMMPGLDGMETTRMIRAIPRFASLPVIALSAFSELEIIDQCRDAGMNDYVVKPLDEDVLLGTLVQCLTQDGWLGNEVPVTDAESQDDIDQLFQHALKQNHLSTQPLDRLKQRFAPERFRTMYRILTDDCRRLVVSILKCAHESDYQTMQRYAHDLCSSAGHCGMVQVVELARALRRSINAGDKVWILALATQLEGAALDSIRALDAHYGPDLALNQNAT